jgi:hypothetical protein
MLLHHTPLLQKIHKLLLMSFPTLLNPTISQIVLWSCLSAPLPSCCWCFFPAAMEGFLLLSFLLLEVSVADPNISLLIFSITSSSYFAGWFSSCCLSYYNSSLSMGRSYRFPLLFYFSYVALACHSVANLNFVVSSPSCFSTSSSSDRFSSISSACIGSALASPNYSSDWNSTLICLTVSLWKSFIGSGWFNQSSNMFKSFSYGVSNSTACSSSAGVDINIFSFSSSLTVIVGIPSSIVASAT